MILLAAAVVAAGACLVAALVLDGVRQLVVGVLAAGLVLGVGAVSPDHAERAVLDLLPVVGYLVAILVLATLVERGGVFAWLGGIVAAGARRAADPGRRLVLLAVLTAAVVTALLTLDATVVLLAPVLALAARGLGRDPWPLDLASVRLANTASILLPVSNLTNLVAFDAAGLTFLHFTLLMAPAWLVVVAAEHVVVRRAQRPAAVTPVATVAPVAVPRPDRLTLVVLGVTLAVIVVGGQLHLEPVWPALAAAVVLGVRAALTRRPGLRLAPTRLLAAGQVPFAVFVLCWAIAVTALADRGGADLLDRLLPDGTGVGSLVVVALVAMVAANLLNNLPATLLLVPLAAPVGPEAVLAVLVGVGVGASATYAGSLANLLWLRNPALEHPADVGRRFHAAGLLVTPVLVVVATAVMAGTAALVGT
ncbi:arsenical pump membrane protein [Nocardioides zeae]|uniref:Arsenical pump membrane protein n=2 Tax=Nocardioides zeae TaxID=1457234 RepID=A0ACC6IE81_9ACTN|nr:SLC13 family permease [Nocardioides zeae]MDQ1106165.1 arsenical pump membrane protein [Nocardioides zeae]MDR6174153.1 arsenical pump membrane protein [Nocardioides zeae]MDR6208960.1 arsenical pump membrane protein [Nocardioides zeae]